MGIQEGSLAAGRTKLTPQLIGIGEAVFATEWGWEKVRKPMGRGGGERGGPNQHSPFRQPAKPPVPSRFPRPVHPRGHDPYKLILRT